MKIRTVLLALVIVGALAGIFRLSAQAIGTTPVTPYVVTGGDLGFRIEGLRGNTPIGQLVVKVDGKWVEADFGSGARPLSTR
jgi:hypothetical protein